MKNFLAVQFGCGLHAPIGWTNFDASPVLCLRKLPVIGMLIEPFYVPRFPKNIFYGDIVRGLPLAPESVDIVYASHVLEHLALNDFRVALCNTYHVLKKGGVFRMVVPDLKIYAQRYILSQQKDSALIFMKEMLMGLETRPRSLTELARAWIGNIRHLWMWDYEALEKELMEAGFSKVRRANYHDSSFKCFDEVEDEDRFKDAVAVEAVKL